MIQKSDAHGGLSGCRRLFRVALMGLLAAAGWPRVAPAQQRDAPVVSVRTLSEAVLATRYPAEAPRLAVRVKRIEAALDELAPVRLVFPEDDALPRGTTQVTLLQDAGEAGWQKAGWALLYIAHYDSVMMTATTVRADAEVDPAALHVAWIETTTFRGEPLRPADWQARLHDGAVFATRILREGQALRRSDLRPAYAAEPGAVVLMRYRRRGVAFDVVCKAREAGLAGEAVRLYSTDTGNLYRARLTGPGTAEWLETL